MSLWIYRRSKEHPGRVDMIGWAAGWPYVVLFAPVLICLLIFSWPLVIGGGFALFMLAKASVLRQGVWTSWGAATMSPAWRRRYRAGYVLMAGGLISMFIVCALRR